MFDNLPAALLTLFLAACVLWLVWRALRRALSRRTGRQEPSLADEPVNARIEPERLRAAATVSTVPDAADVLALKAAIDNLARQVAALEKRLATSPASLPSQPTPRERVNDPDPTIPAISPDHRI